MKKHGILILAVLILLAVLGIQNAGSVEVHFLVWSGTVSLTLILVVQFIIGAAVGALLTRRPEKGQSKGIVRDVDNE